MKKFWTDLPFFENFKNLNSKFQNSKGESGRGEGGGFNYEDKNFTVESAAVL